MSLRINNNASAVNAHRNLKSSDDKLSRTLERLSSGLQISRAADGPAKLVISEQMRAQIGGLKQAIENSETAISLVQTTEANLAEISSLLIGIRQLAIHAANEGVNDQVMLEADQNEIRNALETINRISQHAQFGNKRLLNGSNGSTAFITGDNLEVLGISLATKDSSTYGFDVKITQAATQSSVRGEAVLTDEIVKAGEKLIIIENGRMASYTTTLNDTRETAVQNLKNEIERNGLNVDVALDESNRILVKHREYGSDHSFQVSSSTEGILSKVAGDIEAAARGVNVKGTINGELATGNGQVLTGAEGAKCIDGLRVMYTGGMQELIDEACDVSDRFEESSETQEEFVMPEEGLSAGRVFVSQKSLKFQVGANQNQTVKLSLQNTDAEHLARGILNGSGFKSLNDIDVRTFEGSSDALMLVDKAIDEVTAIRGNLGAFQKNTLESNLSNLRVANENLISAESTIRDVDMALELAEFTKHQIMTQAANAMLVQANQMPPKVLQLLQ